MHCQKSDINKQEDQICRQKILGTLTSTLEANRKQYSLQILLNQAYYINQSKGLLQYIHKLEAVNLQ